MRRKSPTCYRTKLPRASNTTTPTALWSALAPLSYEVEVAPLLGEPPLFLFDVPFSPAVDVMLHETTQSLRLICLMSVEKPAASLFAQTLSTSLLEGIEFSSLVYSIPKTGLSASMKARN